MVSVYLLAGACYAHSVLDAQAHAWVVLVLAAEALQLALEEVVMDVFKWTVVMRPCG